MQDNIQTGKKSLSVLIAGPYRSGTGGDPEKIAKNLRYLESFALPIFEAGHLPFIGEWLALPIVNAAIDAVGNPTEQTLAELSEQYLYPVAHRLIERCDAVLRVPGESNGAELDVKVARQLGLKVFYSLDELLAYESSFSEPVG
ncbi:MAG TPA: DUF4406 domain-containing protein [Oculatellaceae cyanobacterium]